MNEVEIKWYIAQIKPNSYGLAIRNLDRQGVDTFLPKMKITTRHANRFLYKFVYVFPGYIFVGFDQRIINWSKINNTYGVSKILAFNKKPSEVPHDLIVKLKDRYKIKSNLKQKENLQKGDSIKFNNGPFVDLIAKVENEDQQNRIWFFFKFMGEYRKLKLRHTDKTQYNKIEVSI